MSKHDKLLSEASGGWLKNTHRWKRRVLEEFRSNIFPPSAQIDLFLGNPNVAIKDPGFGNAGCEMQRNAF